MAANAELIIGVCRSPKLEAAAYAAFDKESW
jgi:hypothetical protein